jgi:hypothetical protein
MRDNQTWRIAEIFGVREAKFFNEVVDEDDEGDNQIFDDFPVLEHPKSSTT